MEVALSKMSKVNNVMDSFAMKMRLCTTFNLIDLYVISSVKVYVAILFRVVKVPLSIERVE